MRKKLLLLGIAALLGTVFSFARATQDQEVKRLDGSTIKASEIDGTVEKLMKAAEVPGLGLALFNGGKVAYLKAYGVRDKEKNLPLTPDSVMSGASFTKVAFGYLVLQLADQHLLDLDRPVCEYLPKPLPEYPNYADLAGDSRYKRITARMLLSHTSGFANWRWLAICLFGRGNRFAATRGRDDHQSAPGKINAGARLSAVGNGSQQHDLGAEF